MSKLKHYISFFFQRLTPPKKDFKKEFYRIVNLVDSNKPFCFLRFGDGELMIMNNEIVDKETQAFKVDKWTSSGNNKLGSELKKVISISDKNWIFGIPCKCCNNKCKKEYLKLLKSDKEQITYANLFINSNYPHFKKWIENLNRNVVLIANEVGKNNAYPFAVLKYIPIPDDCVNYFENNEKVFIQNLKESVKDFSNQLFFISAGPLSEAIIYYLYSENPSNTYIDLGSSLDEYVHKNTTRPYMIEGSIYNKRVCIF